MKKYYILTVALLAIILTSGSLHAQTTEEFKPLYYAPTNTSSEVSDILKQKQEQELAYQDARAPRFILIDQKGKFALGVGGFVRLVNGVEFKGIIPSSTDEGFVPALISTIPNDNPHSQYRLSAATSQAFLKMVGRTQKLGDFTVYLSTNFEGKNYTPQLRHAYIKFMGFTFGQTWSTLTDLSTQPPTIDYQGANGIAGMVLNPQIRYSRTFAKEKMAFAIATEFPTVNATYSQTSHSIPQSAPDIVGYLQFNYGKNKASHTRASAILRNMAYHNSVADKSEMQQGWGTQITGVWAIHSKVNLFYQAIYGRGIASYLNDLSYLNRDMVPTMANNGSLQTLPMWGMYAGLQYNITKDIYASATYSQSRMYSQDGYAPSQMYKYGQYIETCAFWNVTKDCSLAIEYLHGIKTVQDGTKGNANRMNLMVQYNF